MNKIVSGAIALALLLFTHYSAAVDYEYTGPNYTTVSGSYSTGMMVTGSLTTSAPIPASVTNFDVSALVTSWTFSDGVTTVTSAAGSLSSAGFVLSPFITTDASGNITLANILARNTPLETAIAETNEVIGTLGIAGGTDGGSAGSVCNQVLPVGARVIRKDPPALAVPPVSVPG